MKSENPKLNHVILMRFLQSISIVSLFAFLYTWMIPADPQNALIAGFSTTRILALGLYLFVAIGALIFIRALTNTGLRALWIEQRLRTYFESSINYSLWIVTEGIALIAYASASNELIGLLSRSETNILAVRLISPLAWLLAITLNSLVSTIAFGFHHIRTLLDYLLDLPPKAWLIVAIITAYFLIYMPNVLHQTGRWDFAINIPGNTNVGDDLVRYRGFIESNLLHNEYTGNYPAFTLLFLSPLLLFDFQTSYQLVLTLTLLAFIFSAFVFPLFFTRASDRYQMISLVGILGLFSYGLEFEFQAGQFNLIAFCLVLSAIVIFHHRPKWRILAYLFFSIGLQLKLWPGIFILMLVDDWGDLRTIIKRFSTLLIVNFLGLFLLGVDTFRNFVTAIRTSRFDNFWIGNHSIEGYLYGRAPDSSWLTNNYSSVLIALSVATGLCILVVLYYSIANKDHGLVPELFLVCALGALLIPSISNDYKLPILAAPTILYLLNLHIPKSKSKRSLTLSFVLLYCIGYAITFYSFVRKPEFIKNNLPILFTMMILVVALTLVTRHWISPLKLNTKVRRT